MSLLPALDGRHGDPQISVDGRSLRASELAACADRLVDRLAGARAVAVPGAPSLDTVIAVVAAIRAGVPVVPIPIDAGPVERGHILRDSGASLVLGDANWPDVDLPGLAVADGATGGTDGPCEVADDATALIMYTSGTTGLPKGVVISRRAIAAGLDGLADAWGWTPDDHLVHGLPLFHVHGLVLGVLGPLRIGSRLTHTGRPFPDRYAAAGGSMYFGVPTVWHRVVSSPADAAALSGARLIVSGSAPLPVPVFDEIRRLTGHEPIERYGMTETMITLSTRHDGERRPGWVGEPITGVETTLRSDDGADVPHDGETIGGLQVRGSTLFDHYLNRPDATAAAMTDDGWFVTGDAAVVDAGGFHRIVGRTSIDIIKSGGYKVGAGEVEAALLAHPAVDECAVVGLPDDDLGERIVAYVVGDSVEPAELIDLVARSLSVHKRPREVRWVDELPRNAMGKVQKHSLRT